MNNSIIFDNYSENDFKPSSLLAKYLQLTEKDIEAFLIKNAKAYLSHSPCPACCEPSSVPAFSKFGMKYVQCMRCATVYISPRPRNVDIDLYYEQSSAQRFWRNELSKTTVFKRREKIIKPRLEWILASVLEHFPEAKCFADINTNQYGYVEELRNEKFFKYKILVNPFLETKDVQFYKDFNIIRTPFDPMNLSNEIDVITLFEVGDHTAEIDVLFDFMHKILRKGGLCFMTSILISGFDLQVLWDKASNLFPPDRLNVFSIEGLEMLFKRYHFECIELSTPGILDVDIVCKALEKDDTLNIPRSIKYLLKNRSDVVKKSFQEFLQSALLSSYSRILLRKQ